MDIIETTPEGSRRHSYVGKKGDLRVELHYAAVHPECGREACLYLYRANNAAGGLLVPMCEMWVFDPRAASKRKGNVDAERLWHAVRMVEQRLYAGIESQSSQHRIMDVMVEYLGDLKDHPPETGMDQTLDEWLEDAAQQGFEFFMDVNDKRVVG